MVSTSSPRNTLRTSFVRTWWPWLSIAARLTVGIVWILAGLLKLHDIEDSVRSVRNYQILPEALVRPVGTGLPILEVVLGALLILGLGLRITGALSALVLLAFIIGIASVWVRGIPIECGCFGGSGNAVRDATSKYPWDIARDTGLFILSVLIAAWPRSRLALENLLLPQSRDEEVNAP
jgi:uncharacterized membrane protein YphA (DoxX/SURF4 family)